jgi:arylsulfatase
MWAQVSMTPFSQYKGWTAEGGIRNALIVSGPVVKRAKGSLNGGVMHVADVMPTLLEVGGASYPKTVGGKETPPLLGKSWGPVLSGQADSARTDQDVLAWEIFGNRAVRQGDWKLRWQWRPFGKGEWELFNVAADPAELKDLAAERPDKLKAMVANWDAYVRANNVILPSRSLFETLEGQLPKRVPVDERYPPFLTKRQFVPPADMMADPKP